MKQVLLIVDPQNDFVEGGSLGVNGAKDALRNVAKYITSVKNNNEDVNIYVTQDAHPANHSSFKEFGGIWPVHCVKGTKGFEIFPDLEKSLFGDYEAFYKGTLQEKDEYSIFQNKDNAQLLITKLNMLKDQTENLKIVVCGIAGDYCVLNTIKDLVKNGFKENISIMVDGIASIDGGNSLKEYIIKENILIQ